MWMREKIKIPKGLPPMVREALAEEVIEFIRTRTIAGVDKDGEKFHDYSDKYAKKKGVGVDDVDLAYSNKMLEALSLISHKNGELLIGYKNGTKENAKAEGNILGSYGRDPDPQKARDFLGISKDDLTSILMQYTGEDDE